MRKALLIFIVAGWLLAQTASSPRVPADASTNERLANVEVTLSAVQTQLSALQAQTGDFAKTQVDMQRQLSELSAKVNLFLWVGAAVGVLLLGAAWKSLERKNGVASAPAPPYATYPGFGQWEMDALARRQINIDTHTPEA